MAGLERASKRSRSANSQRTAHHSSRGNARKQRGVPEVSRKSVKHLQSPSSTQRTRNGQPTHAHKPDHWEDSRVPPAGKTAEGAVLDRAMRLGQRLLDAAKRIEDSAADLPANDPSRAELLDYARRNRELGTKILEAPQRAAEQLGQLESLTQQGTHVSKEMLKLWSAGWGENPSGKGQAELRSAVSDASEAVGELAAHARGGTPAPKPVP